MKIGILASEGSWYYRDLERAATTLGHACERLDFARIVASVETTRADVRLLSVNADDIPRSIEHDVIMVRTMPPGSLEQVVFRMDALAQLEQSGTRVINSPKSLECAVDKYLTTARLRAAGLPVPATIVCEHEDEAQAAFEQLGGDVVAKPLFGSEGRGIVRVSDPDLAHRTFRTLMRLGTVLYLQRFIPHDGSDVRVLVLDGQVLGSMRRRSAHDFRTNVARNAVAEGHQPTSHEVELAVRATSATGAFIAGVDLLYDRDGTCYVIEVNAVPGWQAFGKVNRTDVALSLIDRLDRG